MRAGESRWGLVGVGGGWWGDIDLLFPYLYLDEFPAIKQVYGACPYILGLLLGVSEQFRNRIQIPLQLFPLSSFERIWF